ncbi:unnamed protein product [Citrullus colocynthis]|uniref:Uncharacterized protein n=1 Tax=Citrullus colocynthis TaxID=252529 RepID=A0ABP0YUB6_9ROSI
MIEAAECGKLLSAFIVSLFFSLFLSGNETIFLSLKHRNHCLITIYLFGGVFLNSIRFCSIDPSLRKWVLGLCCRGK